MSGFNNQKLLKSVNFDSAIFDGVIQKIKRWRFLEHGVAFYKGSRLETC